MLMMTERMRIGSLLKFYDRAVDMQHLRPLSP